MGKAFKMIDSLYVYLGQSCLYEECERIFVYFPITMKQEQKVTLLPSIGRTHNKRPIKTVLFTCNGNKGRCYRSQTSYDIVDEQISSMYI